MNPAVTKMFGYAPEQLLGKTSTTCPPYHTEHDQYLNNYPASGQKSNRHRPRGAGFAAMAVPSIELAVRAMIVDGVQKFTGIVRDISSRKQAEAQFQQVVESAPNGTLMIDQQGK